MRAIANSVYREHTAPLFAKLDILDIFQVNALHIAKFTFYHHNHLLPRFLQVVKYTAMTQEQTSLLNHVTVVLILSSLQYFTRVLTFLLSQYRLLVRLAFLLLRKKNWVFNELYLN